MPSNITIDREIVLRGDAGLKANIKGNFMEKKRHDSDRFTGIALDTTNRWATSVPGTSDTIAISEVQGGSCLITTGTGDDDSCMIASAIIFSDTKNAEVEFRITISDVSQTALFVGFSDAKSESNNSIAIHYPADSLTTVATDAAGFVIDADHATSSIMCASTAGGSDTTPVDTGIDWADGETKTLRVKLNDDDSATFILDGDVVARIPASVATGTLMCATVQAATRAAGSGETVRIHSYDSWQDD